MPPDEAEQNKPRAAEEGVANRAKEAGLPPDTGPEIRVILVRRSMFRTRPMLYTAHVLAILGLLGGAVYYGPIRTGYDGLAWLMALGAVAVLGSLFVWWLRCFAHALDITNKRTVQRVGIISRNSSEVLHDNIRNIRVDQSFYERIFRVGKLGIASAGHGGLEIEMEGVPDPDRVRRIIDVYRSLG